MTTDASYWQTSAEDAAMQDEHGFIWRAMLVEPGKAPRPIQDMPTT
jgi:hypothetical protein